MSSVATSSRIGSASGLSAGLPVTNGRSERRIAPVSSICCSSGVGSVGQPLALTLRPIGVLGHWSIPSATPSLSLSTGQPFVSTIAPFGVPSHASRPSKMPSPSVSSGQPLASTLAPLGVFGQVSMPSATPSPSLSIGQPFLSTLAPLGVLAHLSRPSYTPSPSLSIGQPLASTLAPIGVLAHSSSQLRTPSRSASFDLPRNVHCSATLVSKWFEKPSAPASRSMRSRTWNRMCMRSRPPRLMMTPAPSVGAPLRLSASPGSCERPTPSPVSRYGVTFSDGSRRLQRRSRPYQLKLCLPSPNGSSRCDGLLR